MICQGGYGVDLNISFEVMIKILKRLTVVGTGPCTRSTRILR